MLKYSSNDDLYNDLFLNNNREVYIKMYLLDFAEPGASLFFVVDSDTYGVAPGVTKATRIEALYSSKVENGDILAFSAGAINAARGTTVSWATGAGSSTFFTLPFSTTISGIVGTDYVTTQSFNFRDDILTGLTLISPLFDPAKNNQNQIVWASSNTIKLKDPLIGTGSNIGASIAYGINIAFLNTSNFYTSSLYGVYSPTTGQDPILGLPATNYGLNSHNKIFFAKKEIQGKVLSGSLRVDGNSPMRRTIDFSCIVDKLFGSSDDLKIRDFDNRKIKVLIGIKHDIETKYDYSEYFGKNATQKDTDGIVWFKLGTFIPKTVNIKHSVDAYSITISAQDKTSVIDGSFGGVIGIGRTFQDPETNQNTNFYDTITQSFDEFTEEDSSILNIKFADDFEIIKTPSLNPVSLEGYYIQEGSYNLQLKDVENIDIGMIVEGPGVPPGTKVGNVFTQNGPTVAFYNSVADLSIKPTDNLYDSNNNKIPLIYKFKKPSFKNFFLAAPLESKNTTASLYIAPSTINFKNSSASYAIYTTIRDWDSFTWGEASSNKKKITRSDIDGVGDITISGYNSQTQKYTSISGLQENDVIYVTPYSVSDPENKTPADSGLNQYMKVGPVSSVDGSFTLTSFANNSSIIPTGTSTSATVPGYKFFTDISYTTTEKGTNYPNDISSPYVPIKYNYDNTSVFVVSSGLTGYDSNTGLYGGVIYFIEEYSNLVNNNRINLYPFSCLKAEELVDIAINQNYIFIANNQRKIISTYPKNSGPKEIMVLSRLASGKYTTGSTDFNKINNGDRVVLKFDFYNIPDLSVSKVYVITGKEFSGGVYKFGLSDEAGNPVVFNTVDLSIFDLYVANNILIFGDNIKSMNFDSNNRLLVSGEQTDITRYSVDENGRLTLNRTTSGAPFKASPSRNCSYITTDSKNNIYGLFIKGSSINESETEIVSYDSDMNILLNKKYSDIINSSGLFSLDVYSRIAQAPPIVSININSKDELCLLIKKGAAVLNKSDGTPFTATDYANLISLNSNLEFAYKENLFFYDPVILSKTNVLTQSGDLLKTIQQIRCNERIFLSSINALRELAPATDNTIEKTGQGTVMSILDDVKGQLGSMQYYYDYDGSFVFKQDKRLLYNDPDLNKTNPYDFDYDSYNVNVENIPFEYDFVKNKNLIVDFNNTVDLASFKNDFFVSGIKKGLDDSKESANIDILYHIIIDDIGLKQVPSNYYHPWQQYIVDQGNTGSSYANFVYYKELKEQFEFKNTRIYLADQNYKYVTGEFLLVNNALSGASNAAAYSIYEVIAGGAPTNGKYPSKKDGSVEYLNLSATAQQGLKVRFYCNAIGTDYKKIQGIYTKIINADESNSIATIKPLRKNDYFIRTAQDGIKYIYQVSDIYYKNGLEQISIDTPICFQLNQINPAGGLGKKGTNKFNQLEGETTVVLGVYGAEFSFSQSNTCYVKIIPIDIYRSGFQGIFRQLNTGVPSSDFSYSIERPNGDPGSWTYFFDIINLPGRYTVDNVTKKKVPVGITDWQSGINYVVGDKVYSDNKIYQAITAGLAGIAPEGFGDSQNLIRDNTGSRTLIWKFVQISIDIEQMTVSKIGSRKSSIFDKDINTLFSPLDALAFYYTEGYYFIVINDYYNFTAYSDNFHKRLESLIKQFNILYPKVKFIVIPDSQVNELFQLSELTKLKDALSVIKRNLYLNFVSGQNISISGIPIYTMEPLGIVKVGDEDSDIFGNFVLQDYSLPLSNEGLLTCNLVKTNPYDDKTSLLEEINYAGSFNQNAFNFLTFR